MSKQKPKTIKTGWFHYHPTLGGFYEDKTGNHGFCGDGTHDVFVEYGIPTPVKRWRLVITPNKRGNWHIGPHHPNYDTTFDLIREYDGHNPVLTLTTQELGLDRIIPTGWYTVHVEYQEL